MQDAGQESERIEILLVEPNPGDARLFAESFTEGKLVNDVETVGDGDEALDVLHQRGDHADTTCPDLILLEPELPGKSGMEVLSEMNDDPALAEIPVIVLTSSEVGEEIVKSHEIEADHYIQKPVESEEVVDFVKSVEEFWLAIVKRESAEN